MNDSFIIIGAYLAIEKGRQIHFVYSTLVMFTDNISQEVSRCGIFCDSSIDLR